ncbi:hypothetical protein R1sor_013666 [Riccia sorocarpa]|uniref:Uncharacterized protein n=1 Tax=Riccia sorocarpa TaxID=122646 RepID=A0ABD3HA69_9MARC
MEFQGTSSVATDRLRAWRPKSKTTGDTNDTGSTSSSRLTEDELKTYRLKRVKRIFSMTTLQEIKTHEMLWELMQKLPGWCHYERVGNVDYILESSQRKVLAQATLPLDLDSASLEALDNFVKLVNKLEHTTIFALWDTFQLCPQDVKPCKSPSLDTREKRRTKIQSSSTSHRRPARYFC